MRLYRLTANYTTAKVKRVVEGGKEYIVAPMVLLKSDTILPGSDGALFYGRKQVCENPSQWNGKLLTLYHPVNRVTGKALSADDPGVRQRQGIGEVRRARVSNGSLVCDGYFDSVRTKKLSPLTYEMLQRGEPISLSTGLFADNDNTPGSYLGQQYISRVKSLTADHVAILPEGPTGACPLPDCGVLIGNQGANGWSADGHRQSINALEKEILRLREDDSIVTKFGRAYINPVEEKENTAAINRYEDRIRQHERAIDELDKQKAATATANRQYIDSELLRLYRQEV